MSSFENNIDGYTYQLGYLNPIPGFSKYEIQDLENIDCRDYAETGPLRSSDPPVPIGAPI